MRKGLIVVAAILLVAGLAAGALAAPREYTQAGAETVPLKLFVTNCDDVVMQHATVTISIRDEGVQTSYYVEETNDGGFMILDVAAACCNTAVVTITPRGGGLPYTTTFHRACDKCADDVSEWAQDIPFGSPCDDSLKWQNVDSPPCCNERWTEDPSFWHVRYNP